MSVANGGYEPKPKLYEIVFGEGTSYEGLEVTLRGVPTGMFLEIQELAEGMSDQPKAAEIRQMLQRIGGLITSWNVTSGGEPVPPGYDGLAALDLDLAMEIFTRWSKAVAGVDPTSPKPSPNGATSAAGQPPGLASASVSLQNSPAPS
jgi:hypothetical protein